MKTRKSESLYFICKECGHMEVVPEENESFKRGYQQGYRAGRKCHCECHLDKWLGALYCGRCEHHHGKRK